ncbi:hypothetical protein FHG87_017734 [Trinorchestia longiramus]|nr:hypothetical protein FHG87_017734 [Trinorchestia longiramus]
MKAAKPLSDITSAGLFVPSARFSSCLIVFSSAFAYLLHHTLACTGGMTGGMTEGMTEDMIEDMTGGRTEGRTEGISEDITGGMTAGTTEGMTEEPAPRPAKVEHQQLKYFLQKDKITSFDAFKPERNLQKQYKNLIISRSKERLVCLFMTDNFSKCSLSVIFENKPLCVPH